jgi:hypothetical protein
MPSQIPTSYQNNFDQFKKYYPTPEVRLPAARQLASPDGEIPPENDIFSRNFLIAHWGDDMTDLQQSANFVYALKESIGEHSGQPIVVVRRGTHEDLFTDTDEEPEDDIELDFGIISDPYIVHAFSGNLSEHGGKRMEVEPPLLGFGVLVPVTNKVRINVDILGECEVEPAAKTDDKIPIYIGTVSLRDDLEGYRKNRKIISRQIVIGRGLCSKLVERVKPKCVDKDSRKMLSKLPMRAK